MREKISSYNVIVANGLLPHTKRMVRLMEGAQHVVVCDGAINTLFTYTSRVPDYVIGDGDSLDPAILAKKGVPFVEVKDQETNDLTKAVMSCVERGWKNLIVLGGTGGREDHSIANVFLLAHYLSMGIEVRMAVPKGEIIPIKGIFDEKVGRKRVVSLFSVDCRPVTATGLKYPVIDRTFDELWQGTLNETSDERLHIECDGRVLLFLGKPATATALAEGADNERK